MTETRPVFRFAPSPNGYLHLGHAYSALTNADAARRCGGRLLLRIEDIDLARCRPEFEAAIRVDLAWLGIAFEEPVMRQSERFDVYREALAGLRRRGLVYPCFCSRGDVARVVARHESVTGATWPRDPDGAPLYPGTCRGLPPNVAVPRAAGEAHVLRFNCALALAACGDLDFREYATAHPNSAWTRVPADAGEWGDVVLGRKELPTSYHLAVVLDDAAQGVTQVVRGLDLYRATSIHRLLQALFGLSAPGYHHHRLILDEAGRKLSKSGASTGLRELRAAGATPSEIRRRIGFGL